MYCIVGGGELGYDIATWQEAYCMYWIEPSRWRMSCSVLHKAPYCMMRSHVAVLQLEVLHHDGEGT